ncbi:hypothetical protein H6G33_10085 [Calothrix sp. FACHB-1219]|uniref:hypothetical protein n=1 Tax=unclassified Calothrix TaxID=2619626 RepID=UPI001687F6D1|nr:MULTISPECIES: hypothetical protein [unclassified Calothrix]MBD2201696.1 hypothetical protein [Calothrix sp. FACHB-168]MBD2217382.1 hypothetical protein [Calothrix sp. FACHB-1219]
MSNNESNKSENNKDIEQEEDIDWILNQPIDMRIIPISNTEGNDDSPRRSINLDSLERNVSIDTPLPKGEGILHSQTRR